MTEYICIIICVSITMCSLLLITLFNGIIKFACEYKDYVVEQMKLSKVRKDCNKANIKWLKVNNEDSTREENTEED